MRANKHLRQRSRSHGRGGDLRKLSVVAGGGQSFAGPDDLTTVGEAPFFRRGGGWMSKESNGDLRS